MNWDGFIGNRPTIDYLNKLVDENSFSHAYLFSGPDGVGKKLAAKLFAKALNCRSKNDICGKCKTCLSIEAGMHPLVSLEPQGSNILISQVRQLIKSLVWKGDQSNNVLIISDIDTMNTSAANAFLKTLEEPPDGLVIVGITSSEDMVIPTIKSRMQTIRFSLLGENEISEILRDSGATGEQSAVLKSIFPGSVGRSITWLETDKTFSLRESTLAILSDLNGDKPFDPVGAAENIYKLTDKKANIIKKRFDQKIDELSGFLGKKKYSEDAVKIIEEHSKREQNSARTDTLRDIFFVIASFYRDCIIFFGNDQDAITNKDALDLVKHVSAALDNTSLVKILANLQETIVNLRYNLDGRLILENLFFILREAYRCRKL